MACRHDLIDNEEAFTVDASRVTFGRGCIGELGERMRARGVRRAVVFSDPRVKALPIHAKALASLADASVDVIAYSEVRVEPTDGSFEDAIRFAREAAGDGYVSIGGGSVMDTCKVANLYASHPAPLEAYVNAPVGEGRAVPGPLAPHIACPTTCGTGSEVTGIAVFDHTGLHAKTGIASALLRPTEALVDPDATLTLPSSVVAASGLDVLSHALESFTAQPFAKRPRPNGGAPRPMSQGANPWSDIGCREALRLLGLHFERAVRDATDREAREALTWAATLAGIAFGNAGVHIPHAMAYAVAGLGERVGYRHPDYPTEHALVPHGISVIVNAPAVFRATAPTSPARHLEAAIALGADGRGAGTEDAGEVLAHRLVEICRRAAVPDGLGGIGYGERDIEALVAGTTPQRRLLDNAPRPVDDALLRALFAAAMRYG